MSDEANFFLPGYVNKQNFQYWSHENPRLLHEKPQMCQKVVWCAIGMCGIIGPYFFKDDTRHAVTVNAYRYCEMLQNFLIPELWARQLVDTIWFQQDSAMAHTSMAVLQYTFPNCLISRIGDLT
jgi:hypothetical protein